MKISRPKTSNIIFIILLALLLIPQTRRPIQVFINKGLALFSPSKIDDKKQVNIGSYDWQLKDINGDFFDFQDTKGEVVLVNFWATWCPPCIAEMPSLQKLYDDYQGKINILLVSNESTEVINRFLKDKNYTFKTYSSITDNPEVLNTKSIPRTFLIDKTGKIIIDETGAANWNSDFVRNTIDNLLMD
ncbi:TlpA family protein disulfide reductase [Mariniflexile ostreae]|uniref:TlpA family protein disulfide reductase n=1 Tax=Mariniflexile ostreae TaxID=1520892 RepID=A0ABV5FET8_9FLAO